MKFDEDLAAIHAYLCADGYVIKNPLEQKQKYYYIGLRNTNHALLADFQKRFYNYFKILPRLKEGERCVVQNKELYEKLIDEFRSFYSNEWSMPKMNRKLQKTWLRTFFDCEGWVFCKTHQNRHIGLDSINEKGLDKIREALKQIGIKSIKKTNSKRKMFRMLIYGKENLMKFRKEVGFFHPNKKDKLDSAISDFVEYKWTFDNKSENVRHILLERAKIKPPYTLRIISKENMNLEKLRNDLVSLFDLDFEAIRINTSFNGQGTKYFELSINKKQEIEKLIKQNLINKKQLNKITLKK